MCASPRTGEIEYGDTIATSALAKRLRAMRLLIATILGCLVLAAPASARYLHLSEATPAGRQYVNTIFVRDSLPVSSVRFTEHCWHVTTHVVQCGFTDEDSSLGPTSHHVAVIALRGDWLYGHTLPSGSAARTFYGPKIYRPRRINRLK